MRQLGAIPDACSPHQGSELALDGFATLAELPGDLLVGPTLDQQTGNGSLRRRQHKRWGIRRAAARRRKYRLHSWLPEIRTRFVTEPTQKANQNALPPARASKPLPAC